MRHKGPCTAKNASHRPWCCQPMPKYLQSHGMIFSQACEGMEAQQTCDGWLMDEL